VPVDTERSPAVELGADRAANRARHEPERVPTKVGQRAARIAGQLELAPERSKLVRVVESTGPGKARPELRSCHVYFDGMTVPQRLQVRASTLP
jgi:hypothetical protein